MGLDTSNHIRMRDFTLVQIGTLNRAEVENATHLANVLQRAFRFDWYPKSFPIRSPRPVLPNGAYDLDSVASKLSELHRIPKPTIFFTSLPFGDRDTGNISEYHFFNKLGFDKDESIVSTFEWERLFNGNLQRYILSTLSAASLNFCAGINTHEETRGCLFDFCDDPAEIVKCFDGSGVCRECESRLDRNRRDGLITMEEVASARKLFNRSLNKRVCFFARPFRPPFKQVLRAIEDPLTKAGWIVVDPEKSRLPRRITDAIVQDIICSDALVADLTQENPNVFYEVGYAHAIGCEVIFISQHEPIPFDVSTDRVLFYRNTPKGLEELGRRLVRTLS